MKMSFGYFDLDGRPLRDLLLGFGGSGVVVERDGIAVKLPRRKNGDSPEQIARNRRFIEHEKEVYRRLQGCYGVVRCLSLASSGMIQMELMKKGNLFAYLRHARMTRTYPSRDIQLYWFRELARTLVDIHDRRVMFVSFFTRNLLLSMDLTIKFSDFGRSILLPLETDMRTVERYGYSISMDIGQFGMILYQVITGGHYCDFGFVFVDDHPGPEEPVWPARNMLPETDDLWLGPLIDKCWTQGAFEDARSLLAELESVSVDDMAGYDECDSYGAASPKIGNGVRVDSE